MEPTTMEALATLVNAVSPRAGSTPPECSRRAASSPVAHDDAPLGDNRTVPRADALNRVSDVWGAWLPGAGVARGRARRRPRPRWRQ